MEQKCESCGMPMTSPEDFGGNKINNKYCVYCTDEHGELKPFDQKVDDMSEFIMRSSNLNKEQALKMAKEALIKMPAWQSMGK